MPTETVILQIFKPWCCYRPCSWHRWALAAVLGPGDTEDTGDTVLCRLRPYRAKTHHLFFNNTGMCSTGSTFFRSRQARGAISSVLTAEKQAVDPHRSHCLPGGFDPPAHLGCATHRALPGAPGSASICRCRWAACALLSLPAFAGDYCKWELGTQTSEEL